MKENELTNKGNGNEIEDEKQKENDQQCSGRWVGPGGGATEKEDGNQISVQDQMVDFQRDQG